MAREKGISFDNFTRYPIVTKKDDIGGSISVESYYFWLIAGILFFSLLNYWAYRKREIEIYTNARMEITEETNKGIRRRSLTRALVMVVLSAVLVYLSRVGLSPSAEKVFGFMIMVGVIWVIYRYMKRKNA